MSKKPTHNELIIAYLTEFGTITQLEALRDLGCMRLASRISDLKRMGYNIQSDTVTVKNHYGDNCHIKQYRLEAAPGA